MFANGPRERNCDACCWEKNEWVREREYEQFGWGHGRKWVAPRALRDSGTYYCGGHVRCTGTSADKKLN